METLRRILPPVKVFFAGALVLYIQAAPNKCFPQQEVRMHYITDWKIEPSLKYDAICLINTLTGDPFYARYAA
jgi:hypothetical protein